ncbi:MAG: hypothetical protein J4F99_04280 [Acidimicrobiia bacterium]|nr:hypothetical protein [Acidimicrobiia bacterium]
MGLVGLGLVGVGLVGLDIRVVAIPAVAIRGSPVDPAVGSRVGLVSLVPGRRRRRRVLWRCSGGI